MNVKRITLSHLRRLEQSGTPVMVSVELEYEAGNPVWVPLVHLEGRTLPLAFDDASQVKSLSLKALCNLLSECGVTHAALCVEQISRAYRMAESGQLFNESEGD